MKHHPTVHRILGALAASLLAVSAVSAQEGALPSVAKLVARYIEVTGGEEAIRSVESMSSTGTMGMPAMGMEGRFQMIAAQPNRMWMEVEMPGVGTITTGYDGETAWIVNPMTGPMLLEGEQLRQLERDADLDADLQYETRYPVQETVGEVEFAGEAAYKVRLVDVDEKESFEYFSKESGFKIGSEAEQATEMGEMFITTEMRDYQNVEGRWLPMTTVAKMMGMEMVTKLEGVEFNGVEDSTFEVPETIKTLLAQKQ